MDISYQGANTYLQTAGYDIDPAKPTVCFVHGAGMDHAVWTLFVRHFARNGCNAIAPDLRGHGRSAGDALTTIEDCAGWLLGLFDALGLGPVAVAGHSMGSLIALQAAATGGERVRAVALLGFGYPMAVGAPLHCADAVRRAPSLHSNSPPPLLNIITQLVMSAARVSAARGRVVVRVLAAQLRQRGGRQSPFGVCSTVHNRAQLPATASAVHGSHPRSP